MRPPDPQNERKRPLHTAASRQINPGTGRHDLIASGPLDEARPRVEAITSNLTAALRGRLPLVATVEASVAQLEAVGRYLRMVA